jgi:rubrerythrin
MAWGAANELTTLSAYHRLIAKTEHPQLVQMLQAIIKDERRHFAFYRAQARLRLQTATARRITRWSMEHLWAPVGTGVRP